MRNFCGDEREVSDFNSLDILSDGTDTKFNFRIQSFQFSNERSNAFSINCDVSKMNLLPFILNLLSLFRLNCAICQATHVKYSVMGEKTVEVV